MYLSSLAVNNQNPPMYGLLFDNHMAETAHNSV